MSNLRRIFLSMLFCLIPAVVLAGDLVAPAAPTDAGSAMYTLETIYNRLDAGTPGSRRPGAFTEPSSGPTAGTGHTLNDVMGKAPSVDDTNGAGVAEVLDGKTFWGLKSGVWGTRTGTLATQTLSADSTAVAAGNYAATTLNTVDPDLATGNIKSGTAIFGVPGDGNVVNTSSGDAAATDMLSGKKAWVDGGEVTGNVTAGSTVSGADGLKTFTITNGLYSGNKTATANDTDLVTGNIRNSVTIFGVSGKTEVVDTSSGDAVATDILSGKKAWVDGSEVTGNVTAGSTVSGADGLKTFTITNGLYSGNKTATANDTDLVTGNIRNSVTIFGVPGKTEVVDTTSGDATAGDISLNKKAWVDGAEIIGSAQSVTDRYLDHGNDTVRDQETGLMWTKNANRAGSQKTWADAVAYCEAMNAGAGTYGYTDWRLPSVQEQDGPGGPMGKPELDTLGRPGGIPGAGDYTKPSAPFTGVQSDDYWSSTTLEGGAAYAWIVDLDSGAVNSKHKTFTNYVWPVRGGQ